MSYISAMHFALPLLPAEFEIPDAWWIEAGMTNFTPSGLAYRSTPEMAGRVPLREIEPPFRNPEEPKDFHGFDHDRLVLILKGFVADAEIPPVPLLLLPSLADISKPPFKYRVLDGLHRFYASVAAGFEFLPVTARKCFR
jgi:hypothetical protein